MGLKLKKGEKLIFVGFERDSQKNLSKIIFETPAGNKLVIEPNGEDYQYHFISMRVVDEKKPEEELEVP